MLLAIIYGVACVWRLGYSRQRDDKSVGETGKREPQDKQDRQ
jgi:hypothetical protein